MQRIAQTTAAADHPLAARDLVKVYANVLTSVRAKGSLVQIGE